MEPEYISAELGSISSFSSEMESAISSTEIAARSAEGLTLLILQDHLKKLCKMQRATLRQKDD